MRQGHVYDHLRFAIAYWHTFGENGADPFGRGTRDYPWLVHRDPVHRGKEKMDAAFEFITKLGVPFYCFHDLDLVDEGGSIAETERRLEILVNYARSKQAGSGVRLLWGTANLFSHPRYMNGAATNPDLLAVAHAGTQVKHALDATIALGGSNYVFWGGREGYMSLLNTNMKREREHMARDYGRSQGFKGTFLIEPKPMEPMKHQYDFDASTVIGFLREFGLVDDFKLNIEVNHATLARHTFQHELQVAADAGLLGSIDAKTRRNSTDLEDVFIAHVAAMDAFARALMAADRILHTTPYVDMRIERYHSFDSGRGVEFEHGKLSLEDLRTYAMQQGEPERRSGKQELYEAIISQIV